MAVLAVTMPQPAFVTIALLIWTLGACLYTAALWPARGATDAGPLGLLVMILGSGCLAWVLIEIPPLAVCALLPAVFAGVLLGAKLRDRIRTRWHRPPPERPAMLSRHPAPAERPVREARDLDRLLDPDPAPLAPIEAERERARSMERIFG